MNYRAAMMRNVVTALAFIFLSLTTSFAQEKQDKKEQQDQEPTVKIGTALVVVPVIVTDRYGRFVSGLARNDFLVREDGVGQKIEDFSSTEAPFNVALLLDTSRSTQNKLNTIRKAALAFIKQLQPNDRVMIVTFDERVQFISDFTNNRNELERAVKVVKSGYLTSLYDAIYQTISEKMSKIRGRKAIVVLTDGVDTASKQGTFENTLDLIASSGIISYAIQYETRNDGGPVMKPITLPNGSASRLRANFSDRSLEWRSLYPHLNTQAPQLQRDRYLIAADYLRSIALQSGARYIRAENIDNTSFAFKLIADELRNQYTLTYISSNEKRDGSFRAIAVSVNRSDLIVRPRLGYRAPKADPTNTEPDKKPDNPKKNPTTQ